MSKRDYLGSKHVSQKYERAKFLKRAKKVALHVQSRRENKFAEETLRPDRHLSRRDQRYAIYQFALTHRSLLQNSPLGQGW
jgi:hypothetical protein